MQIASSANRTCSEFLSASLYPATVRIPISLHALITRSAISPRLAINTLRNMSRLCLTHYTSLWRRMTTKHTRTKRNTGTTSTTIGLSHRIQMSDPVLRRPIPAQNNPLRRLFDILSPLLSVSALPRPDGKQRLSILHRLSTRSDPPHYLAGDIGLNLIHQLHRLDDADHLPHLHLIPHLHKRRCARRRRLIKRPHNRRLHLMQLFLQLIRKCSRSTRPRGSSTRWSNPRGRSHQPAQLGHIEP